MIYQGVIKKSRTLDLAAVDMMLNAVAVAVLVYTPEQLGIPIFAFVGLKIFITALQAYLRFQTTGPVGDK